MWRRLVGLSKNVGLIIAGLAIFVLMIGLSATCQFAQGQLRPYLPPIVRDLLTDPEDKAVIDEYLGDVDGALDELSERVDICNARRDQPCLTAAFEKAWRDVESGLPVEASWMESAHTRLRDALYAMWQLHLRSETEPMTTQFLQQTEEAASEFIAAVDEWYEQAQR